MNLNTSNFYKDLDEAQKESESKYRDLLENKFPGAVVYKPDDNYICDTIMVYKERPYRIENKYDKMSEETGNVFFEVCDYDKRRKLGLLKDVEYVVYNFPGDETFYRFRPLEMFHQLAQTGSRFVLTHKDPLFRNWGYLCEKELFINLDFVKKDVDINI